MGDAVPHHEPDRLAWLDPRIVESSRDELDECGYLIAGLPLSGELDEWPVTVSREPGRK